MTLHLGMFLIWYLVFVFSTTFHEFAHAALAYRGGDLTAYEGGQLSLDPLPHIRRSPFGMVVVPILSYALAVSDGQSGWMLGWASVPFDPRWASRHPRRHALMSLAGPMANLLLALVSLLVIRLLLGFGAFEPPDRLSFDHLVAAAGTSSGSPLEALAIGLSIMLYLNALLGLFNLMPAPPLDGAAVVEGLAPRTAGPFYRKLQDNPGLGLLVLFIAWILLTHLAVPLFVLIVTLIYR